EAGVYDSPQGTALVLANFTYLPVENLEVEIDVAKKPVRVVSCETGPLNFVSSATKNGYKISFSMELKISDIVLIEL
ncbi:MAG TPA: hypothetical protein PLS78_01655, partial [bacterium]|nr:hypothetical protein [bacterium]